MASTKPSMGIMVSLISELESSNSTLGKNITEAVPKLVKLAKMIISNFLTSASKSLRSYKK